ncbi:hypothetical protein B7P43_G00851 [Cryptotermes secundus]|uniref:Lipid-binding serum glycoprotein N-terminal domain-containing protein n=1 Tax=Cryptotermes secundus TaxID=105785 RepID=A0A2J7PK77_9NEOP|nr:hypothetical protein B7P43_G00851 [Cryptotermes secundus]
MKNLSDLANIVLLVIVFSETLGFEYGVRGDILKVYRSSKEGLISSESRIFEDTILKNIISAIRDGSECLGIPPLDPFDYEDNIHIGYFEIKNTILLDYVNLDGVHSTKLSDFLVHTFTFGLVGLEVVLNITFPEINLQLEHYNISGIGIDIIPFEGDGEIQLTVRDVNVATSFSFGVSEAGTIFLDTLSLELAVGEVKFSITGLMGGSRTSYLASDIGSSAAPKAIRELQALYGPEIIQELKKILNDLLTGEGLSSSDILSCLL